MKLCGVDPQLSPQNMKLLRDAQKRYSETIMIEEGYKDVDGNTVVDFRGDSIPYVKSALVLAADLILLEAEKIEFTSAGVKLTMPEGVRAPVTPTTSSLAHAADQSPIPWQSKE